MTRLRTSTPLRPGASARPGPFDRPRFVRRPGERIPIGRIIAAVVLAAMVAAADGTRAADTVQIDRATRYQTIQSWGAPAGLMGNPDALMGPLLDELVQALGLTRLRFEPPRREWEDVFNDDTDPFHLEPGAFEKTGTDLRVAKVFLPFKQRVEVAGERFEFYVSPSFFDGGSSGTAPGWLLNNPGEYAEWASAFLQYLRSRYNLHADYYSICNEAGNNNAFSASAVATLIKTVAPRLAARGLRTRIEFPECVSADTSWSYIQSTQNDAEMWRHVGLVSYHLYGGNNSRPQIRDFAWARNLPTGQTEYMGLNLDRLYDDLMLGGVSTWEYYALNDILTVNSSRTWFSRTSTFWQTRQVLRFVRPGAVRIAATTNNAALRALAVLQNDRTTLILINTNDGAARTVDVSGLTPGLYGRAQTAGGNPAQELGPLSVSASGAATLNLPANAVLTLYPLPGTNLPPFLTDWKSTPTFLKQPTSTITLSASATDPELATLTYAWSLLSAPAGTAVRLNTPNTASCVTTGLTASGDYLFQIVASDGTNATRRDLPLTVYSGNQPPDIFDLHNRLPVTVTLPTISTTLRCAGRDLENDALTFQWSLASQPTGAAATLLSPTTSGCVATNLTVAGDYLFRITVRDSTHTVSNEISVTVHPTNRPPVVASAAANPASFTLPVSTTTLSVTSIDPDGDALSHWWSLSSGPAGAAPVIANPGATNTSVTGLIVPGSYTFKVVAVDRVGVATRNVTLNVSAGTSPALLFLASPNGGETFSARQTIFIRWASHQVPGNVKLEFHDGTTGWQTIANSTANDGIEAWTLPHGNFTGCKVRISDAATGAVVDESDGTFSISADTPRFQGLILTNGQALLRFDPEPGLANFLQRTAALSSTAQWQTVAVFSNTVQALPWIDPETSNLPTAFYRLLAQ